MDQKKIREKLLEMLHDGLIPLTKESQEMFDKESINYDDGWNIPYITDEMVFFPGREPVYLKNLKF